MMINWRRKRLQIDRLWKELASAPEHPASRRVDESHPLDLFAYVGSVRKPGLLLVAKEQPPVPRQYNAVAISRSLRPDNRWVLLIQLRRPELLPLFAALCQDLVESSRNLSGNLSPSEFLIQRLQRWKRLMEADRGNLLSPEEIRGLMGELVLLINVAIPRWGLATSISCWQGPFEAPQDFVFPELNLEVKTVFPGTTKVRVASLEQLETFNARLLLAIMILAPAPEENESCFTLGDLVRTLRTMIRDDEALVDFEMRLAAVGYVDRDEYDQTRMRLQNIRFFEILDGFPRITRNSVLVGIDSVTYTVDLSFCGQFEISGLG